MTIKTLQLEPLTASAFEPFGDVFALDLNRTPVSINAGNTQRFGGLADLCLSAPGLSPDLSIFRSKGWQLPLNITALERHPHTSQAFIPLDDTRFIIAVAPPGELSETDICAFLSSPGQGINYKPGTWHHYHLAFEQQGDVLVIDAQGTTPNCDEVLLSQPISLCR